MCGRYMLTTPLEALRDMFGVVDQLNLGPRYNIAPTQDVPVVRLRVEDGATETRLSTMRWGLVPSWAKGIPGSPENPKAPIMINARAETIAEKPSFRAALKRRRCLIPADGFFEWRKLPAEKGRPTKQPYRIGLRDWGPFAFAGLWESWKHPDAPEDEKPLLSCTIVTTAANATVAPIHDRMPVILPTQDHASWLAPETEMSDLTPLLRPFPAEAMATHPVSQRVGSPRHDDPELIAPVAIDDDPLSAAGQPGSEPATETAPPPRQGSLF